MLSHFLFIPFFISFVLANTRSNDDDILYWRKDQLLTFADFQGKPSQQDTSLREVSAGLLTHTLGAIIKSIDVQVITQKGKTTYTIFAGMKKNLSWLKNGADSLSLKHEQGHFDICEIYARRLRSDIRHAKTLQESKDMFDRLTNEEEAEQDRFDLENTIEFGGITPFWKKQIKEHLTALDAYQEPIVVVLIDK